MQLRTILLIGVSASWALACGDDITPNDLDQVLTGTRPATAAECPDGGTTLISGADVNRDGVLGDDEIALAEPVCDPPDGVDGQPGEDGSNALVSVVAEPAGDNCANGGQRIDSGVDDNDDGALDTEEVDTTSYVCDGDVGPAGLNFLVRTTPISGGECEGEGVVIESGLDLDASGDLTMTEVQFTETICAGDEGLDVLVDIVAEPAGANCSAGGQQIRRGVDGNRSGALDPAEIESVSFLCNPVATLTVTTTIAAGADCANGGLRLDTGLDANGDGALQSAEVNATQFLCTGVDGAVALVDTATVAPGTGPCANGGVQIDSGFDDNGDGALGPDEVTSTSFACDAAPGLDGRGASAVAISPEPAGSNCANGGTRVETGPDTNGDGVLQPDEVTSTRFTCSGASQALLVDVVSIPAGPVCADGGQSIREGLDTNMNGVLDDAEVTSSTQVCVPSNNLPMDILSATLPDAFETGEYEQEVEAVGGVSGSYRWSLLSGALPPGLSIDQGTPAATIEGVPTSTGTFTFEFLVTDGFGGADTQSLSITVLPPPCAPGVGGQVGDTVTTITVGSSFGSGITGLAADESATGFVYFMDDGSSLERFDKTTGAVTDVVPLVTGLVASDVNYVFVDGSDIYVTSDDTSCQTDCVWRISQDAGVTFSLTDLGDFSSFNGGTGTGDQLKGGVVDGNSLFVITKDFNGLELYELDLTGTFPVVPTLLLSTSDVDECGGLAVDDDYLYTLCDGGTAFDEGLVRIDRTTFAIEVTAIELAIGSITGSQLYADDLDADGLADVIYAQGDSGNQRYFCDPSGTFPAFSGDLGGSGDDEGLAFDPVNNQLFQIDEGTTSAFRID